MRRVYPGAALALLFFSVSTWATSALPTVEVVFLFLSVALASVIAVGAIRSFAFDRLLDVPNERSSHLLPTPRGGGLIIVALALAGLCTAAVRLSHSLDFAAAQSIAAGGMVVAAIGLWDDLRSLSARFRLMTHIIAAVILTATLGPIRAITFTSSAVLDLGMIAYPLTILWIGGLTNAYNFMDGIDGIAATQAIVAGFSWAIIAALANHHVILILSLSIAGACIGFLWHNWPPARIFMGDVASGFLGFVFASLGVYAAQTEPRAVVSAVLFVWPFIFDSAFTFARRAQRRERVFEAHRSHLYQRLVIAGASHESVTVLYLALATLCAITGIAFYIGLAGSTLAGIVMAMATALVIPLVVRFKENRKVPS